MQEEARGRHRQRTRTDPHSRRQQRGIHNALPSKLTLGSYGANKRRRAAYAGIKRQHAKEAATLHRQVSVIVDAAAANSRHASVPSRNQRLAALRERLVAKAQGNKQQTCDASMSLDTQGRSHGTDGPPSCTGKDSHVRRRLRGKQAVVAHTLGGGDGNVQAPKRLRVTETDCPSPLHLGT